MSIRLDLIETIDVKNTLGEGVSWRESDQTLWWTDIQEKALFKISWPDGRLRKFDLPNRLGSFGFVEDDDSRLVCAFENGFAYYRPDSGKLDWIAQPKQLREGRRLNDGRVAPDGSFWCGSMLEDGTDQDTDTGLYQLKDGQAQLLISGLRISNGLAWSHLGDEMYFSDSHRQLIFRTAYPVTPFEASQYEVFAHLKCGAPDGAAVDKAGRYWAAIWGESCVRCYLPNGEVLLEADVPAQQPTCVAFGGASKDLLFVTSALEGLSEEALASSPSSGNVFVFQTDTAGATTHRFRP
jgi:sugar lactone lactonase YvrE